MPEENTRTKSSEDIAAITEVARAAEAALAAVVEYLKTEKEPAAEAAHAIIDEVLEAHGCESPEGHIVASGPASAEPHERGSGIIREGEPIVIDVYPRSKQTGYYADITRTVCLGEPSPELARLCATVREAHALATSMVLPGVSAREVYEEVCRFFNEQGYATSGTGTLFPFAEGFVHGLGHGVGLDVHEPPRLGRASKDVLAVGDVITIEPGLYYEAIGGVRIEDLYVIRKTGVEPLTRAGIELQLL